MGFGADKMVNLKFEIFFEQFKLFTKKTMSKSTLLFLSFPQSLSGNPVFSLFFLDSCFRRNDCL